MKKKEEEKKITLYFLPDHEIKPRARGNLKRNKLHNRCMVSPPLISHNENRHTCNKSLLIVIIIYFHLSIYSYISYIENSQVYNSVYPSGRFSRL